MCDDTMIKILVGATFGYCVLGDILTGIFEDLNGRENKRKMDEPEDVS